LGALLAAGWADGLGLGYLAALTVAACLLAYGQSIVSPRDLTRLDRAFFTVNGWVSVLIFLGGLSDILRR
jgi:4-hydroxybenzoate polyprenyltransferase